MTRGKHISAPSSSRASMPTLKTNTAMPTTTTHSGSHGDRANTSDSPVTSPSAGQIANVSSDSNEDAPPLPSKDLPEQEHAPQPSVTDAPSLPYEFPPPLPNEAPPGPPPQDNGWERKHDPNTNAYYYYNRYTHASMWENSFAPYASTQSYASTDYYQSAQPQYAPGTEPPSVMERPVAGGYNPKIHGHYDPNADYAILAQQEESQAAHPFMPAAPDPAVEGPGHVYAQQAAFNRSTGQFTNTAVHPTHTPDAHTDEAKSRRQMTAFFDVDAAANSHGGRSLKAERQARKLSKKELDGFKQKRRAKKEDKRRAWLKD